MVLSTLMHGNQMLDINFFQTRFFRPFTFQRERWVIKPPVKPWSVSSVGVLWATKIATLQSWTSNAKIPFEWLHSIILAGTWTLSTMPITGLNISSLAAQWAMRRGWRSEKWPGVQENLWKTQSHRADQQGQDWDPSEGEGGGEGHLGGESWKNWVEALCIKKEEMSQLPHLVCIPGTSVSLVHHREW